MIDENLDTLSARELEERINRLRTTLDTETDPDWQKHLLGELASLVRARALIERKQT